MYKKIFFLFLLLLASDRLFAQKQAATEESSYGAEEPLTKLITAIEVRGNQSIGTNTIISKIKTKIGSPYQENIVSDDLKRLYLLGYFSDIKIDSVDYKDGLKLIITVVERPIIEKIAFMGIKRLYYMKEDKMKEDLKSKEGQYLDYPNLTEDILTLKKIYEKKGFSQAEIDYQVDLDPKTNKARVQFNITEGARVRIKNIYVEGNTVYKDRRILKLMKTKRAWLFNPGILKEEVLKEDIERIKSFYRRQGFVDVAVDYEVKTDLSRPKKPLLYLAVKIQEGQKYLVGNITIQGNKDISRQELFSRLKACTPDKVFSHEALKEDIANIQGIYFDRGYIFNQVQETVSLNPSTGRVDIAYNIIENEFCYVERIKIRGNIKTKDVVIRRELRLRPGDRFDGEKLRRSKERLQNLGFFEEISYATEDTLASNKKDLVVEVKETKTGAFSFGGGYSTIEEFMGFFEIEQKNFDWKNFPYFTGDGQDLKFRTSLGTITESFELSFTEPWLFDYPVSFGFDLYKRGRSRQADIGYGYDEDVSGGDIRLGKEISEYVRVNFTYRYDTINITNISESASNDLKNETGKNSISSAEGGLTYDSRDNVFDPSKGNLFSAVLTLAGGPFGGDKDFVKLFGEARHYLPVFTNSVLQFRARIGLADAFGDSRRLPIYERYFAGGAYTIRGYRERKVGPIDSKSEDPLGGESLFIGNLEYTYPLFDVLKLAVFYDIGNVWSRLEDFDWKGLKSGMGLGFRLKTPLGPVPVVLDYGIPLNKEAGEERKGSGRFHFRMSYGF